MKKLIRILMASAIVSLLGVFTEGCAPKTGKAWIKKEQKYRNYESAMKRAKKSYRR